MGGGRESVKKKPVVLLVSCDGAHVKNAEFSEIINGEGVGGGWRAEREKKDRAEERRRKREKKTPMSPPFLDFVSWFVPLGRERAESCLFLLPLGVQ